MFILALGKKMGGKVGGKMGAVAEKKVMPVETDPHKLVNYVCGSNIYVKGEDVKVKRSWIFETTFHSAKKLFRFR